MAADFIDMDIVFAAQGNQKVRNDTLWPLLAGYTTTCVRRLHVPDDEIMGVAFEAFAYAVRRVRPGSTAMQFKQLLALSVKWKAKQRFQSKPFLVLGDADERIVDDGPVERIRAAMALVPDAELLLNPPPRHKFLKGFVVNGEFVNPFRLKKRVEKAREALKAILA